MKVLTTMAALAAVLASPCLPQEGAVQKRKTGTILKSEVDGLVSALRQVTKGRDGFGTVQDTARALTAMGYCHRLYSAADGPVVRPALSHLFSGRLADGTFTDAGGPSGQIVITTAWVMEALKTMDAERYAEDIRRCAEFLEKKKQGSVWEAEVAAVLAEARNGTLPQQLGAGIAAPLRAGLPMVDGVPDTSAIVEMLLKLTACQQANGVLDRQDAAGKKAEFPAGMQKGIAFLLTQQENGVFYVTTPGGRFPDAGMTALGLAALQTKPIAARTQAEREVVTRGIQWLLEQQNEDGSFGKQTVNYVTCCAVKALAQSQSVPMVRSALDRAQKFILSIQNAEDAGYEHSDRDYGSIGYGGDQRGDLSNVQFAVEALRLSGVEENHEALAKALVFLQRTQNLKGYNDFTGKIKNKDGSTSKVRGGNDGGSAYYPGNSPAGYIDLPDGSKIPRSYGSMTYALLKSYTLAGLKPDDPRVQAAVQWIQKNWTVDINPGSDPKLGEKARYQGLFYYYMVLAQALEATGIDTVSVQIAEGQPPRQIDWRKELSAKLLALQDGTGSWVNKENSRWYEGFGLICTSYAMLALEPCYDL